MIFKFQLANDLFVHSLRVLYSLQKPLCEFFLLLLLIWPYREREGRKPGLGTRASSRLSFAAFVERCRVVYRNALPSSGCNFSRANSPTCTRHPVKTTSTTQRRHNNEHPPDVLLPFSSLPLYLCCCCFLHFSIYLYVCCMFLSVVVVVHL